MSISFKTFLVCSFLFLVETGLDYAKPANRNVSDSSQLTLFVMTGSDWCLNCRRFEINVLHDSSFIQLLKKKNIDLQILDFPQRKKLSALEIKYNDSMASALNFNGTFPGLILRNKSSKQVTLAYKNETASAFSTVLINSISRLE